MALISPAGEGTSLWELDDLAVSPEGPEVPSSNMERGSTDLGTFLPK